MDAGDANSLQLDKSESVESSGTKNGDSNTSYRRYRAPTTDYKFDLTEDRWVPKPTQPGELVFNCTDQNFSKENIQKFLQRWPPSRTPLPYGDFILVHRYNDPEVGLAGNDDTSVNALVESFKLLVDNNNVTAHSIAQISKEHKVLSAKWMIFTTPDKIDALWAKIVDLVCVHRKSQIANVSTVLSPDPTKAHVICVWVDDCTDKASVKALRRFLRFLGIRKRIGLKPDAYTYLDIYTDNPWGFPPSIYY
ncbi:translation initiation factor eIF 4e-like domain-containing protein, partial [Panaeolus papilionaceus]